MSSELYLQKMRTASSMHNPYYEFFRDSVGKGDNMYYSGIGDIYSSVPEFQRGYGVLTRGSALPFRPQLGYGWSSWISNLFRFAKPLLKRGVKEVADLTSKVANDAIQGTNIKDSLKRRTVERASELIDKVPDAFTGLIRKTKGSGLRSRSLNSNVSANGGKKKRLLLLTKENKKKKQKKKKFNQYPALDLIG